MRLQWQAIERETAMAEAARAGSPTGGTGAERRRWQASGTRKLVLSFVFMLLLPFYASLGPMLFLRLKHGLVFDTVGLALFGFAFTVLMGLILIQLVHSIRSDVVLDDTGVRLTLPAVGRGPTPLLRFNSETIPYAQVQAVETRSEVYGEALAPALLKSTRLSLKDGRQLVLGYVNEHSADQAFPYPAIGAAVAARAGLAVKDHGVVRRSMRKRVLGLATTAEENIALSAVDIAAINSRHARNMWVVVGGLALMLAGGMAIDAFTASQTTFAGLGGDASQAQPAKKR